MTTDTKPGPADAGTSRASRGLTIGLNVLAVIGALLLSQGLQPPPLPQVWYLLYRVAPLIPVLVLQPVVALRLARGQSGVLIAGLPLLLELALLLAGPAPFVSSALTPWAR